MAADTNPASGGKPAAKKPKITAAEARKKLQAAGKPGDGGADAAKSSKKKKPTAAALNLPQNLSKQVGLKPDAPHSAGAAGGAGGAGVSVQAKVGPNVALHTTNRDRNETRKVRGVLLLAVVVVAGLIAVAVYFQLRDPAAILKARLLKLEMGQFSTAIGQVDPAVLKPGKDGKVSVPAVTAALMQTLNKMYVAKVPGAAAPSGAKSSGSKSPAAPPAQAAQAAQTAQAAQAPTEPTAQSDPELYSLDLARQLIDPFDQPVRISVVGGKIVVRSFGPDKIDQTGDESSQAKGDDAVAGG
ncbi:MAG: hypothetical protein ACREJ2_08510 [Planctomycetota bacterium]